MLRPYELPHACETEGVAQLLAVLKPTARRALRAYIHLVEFGELRISEWLLTPTCPVSATRWWHLRAEADFRQALDAYKAAFQQVELAAEQKAVAGSQRTLRLAAGRAAERLVDSAQGDIGGFFKLIERWTTDPLPSQDILAEELREDPVLKVMRKHYLVRQAVLDLERLTDPRYSRQVRKFTDSPRTGISFELYDAQRAAESILDRADAETASKGRDGAPIVIKINGDLPD